MNMRWPPGVVMVPPWISTWLDRNESIRPGLVGYDATRTEKVRVERRWMIIARVAIAPGGICLPDLDHCIRNAAAILVHHAARDHDPLSQWRLCKMQGQVVVRPANRVVAV